MSKAIINTRYRTRLSPSKSLQSAVHPSIPGRQPHPTIVKGFQTTTTNPLHPNTTPAVDSSYTITERNATEAVKTSLTPKPPSEYTRLGPQPTAVTTQNSRRKAASRPSPSTGPSDGSTGSSTTGTDGRGNLLRYVRNRIGRAPDQSKGLNELLVMGWTPELAEELYQLLVRRKTTVKELESMVRLQRLSRVTLDETLRILGDMSLRALQAAGVLP